MVFVHTMVCLILQYVSNELLISYNYRYQILYRHTEVFRFVEGSLQSRNHSCMLIKQWKLI